jgi:hypothetical protein
MLRLLLHRRSRWPGVPSLPAVTRVGTQHALPRHDCTLRGFHHQAAVARVAADITAWLWCAW